ncbi:DUF881 domain-containing protein [Kitasatospora sp. GP82]|uniref:DUF881 domain-containing protein n=1 Tax=Kitasatospora sp. GP82 TaxID=3035089 RepID=UPI00247346E1|nr:DUF881 domain-containing protein [Kitasatospora sp. GP82]MDH6125109.1 uncharacterized protein YlxW (UPF0749 family) [Kitasatospora sp. GP82]
MPAPPTPSDRAARYARPDASMSLLTNVMDHSLDEGYAEAARARGDEGSSRLPASTRGRLTLALGLALAATVVTVGAVNSQEAAPTLAKERDALVHRVNDATGAADKLQKQIEDLRDKVEQAQQHALSTEDDGGLSVIAGQAGTGEVSGPGVKLVIEDASGTGVGGSANNPRQTEGFQNSGRLKDRDLQLVVNGLWLAGAEGVAINGQRLTVLSAIRAAGDAVLVDNRPLVPPYTVLSIGDGPRLAKAFQDGEAGHYLRLIQEGYGIKSSLSTQKKVSLPGALGITLRYAQPVTAASPPAPASSPTASPPPSAPPKSTGSPKAGGSSKSSKSTSTPTATGASTP